MCYPKDFSSKKIWCATFLNYVHFQINTLSEVKTLLGSSKSISLLCESNSNSYWNKILWSQYLFPFDEFTRKDNTEEENSKQSLKSLNLCSQLEKKQCKKNHEQRSNFKLQNLCPGDPTKWYLKAISTKEWFLLKHNLCLKFLKLSQKGVPIVLYLWYHQVYHVW